MTEPAKKEKYVAQTILGVVFPVLAASIELTTGIYRRRRPLLLMVGLVLLVSGGLLTRYRVRG